MSLIGLKDTAAGAIPRRLYYYNAGFLRQPHLRQMLSLAGYELRVGLPGPDDGVVVWGRSPYAKRGETVAARYNVPLVRIEDAFLRSIRPGRMGAAPLGLLIDGRGVHFDSATASSLETILAKHPLDDSNLLTRARDGLARIRGADLSKYNMHHTDVAIPAPGYVLVVDQTAGDASIRHSGANTARFAEMLATAQIEHPTARIVIKTHPETQLGLRGGHFSAADQTDRIQLCTAPASPWALLDGAIAVYTVSSQLGFEAILAGHRPRVFGQPFYAGWGLTADAFPIDRRIRTLTKTQLFAAAMILAPTWVDPCRNRLCSFEEAVDQLEAEARAFREDRAGHVAFGMRVWKRGRLQAVFGREKPLIFRDNPTKAIANARETGRGLLIWAGKEPKHLPNDITVRRVEDGFLRSRGLGAELVPPLSLVTDDLGIYYDPTRESRLEHLIQTPLTPDAARRTEKLIAALIAARLSKYNLSGAIPDLPDGPRILVPGQVEDDASIRLGAGDIRTNLALLQAARSAYPYATIIYKPHPDVEAGLRPGMIPDATLRGLADAIAHNADPIHLIEACDEVFTMTSLLGFEALLRGKRVTCLGAPFYAGWGLTQDLGPIHMRRKQAPDGHPLPRPGLLALAHATLIAYPRYYDPVSRKPCPPETIIHRLATGTDAPTGLGLRLLAKLQGRFATYSRFWR
ncbi:capsular polysaccharide biosynthesis protein [Cypionkella sp.]|uniref:capsular polysaccharide biosynthesis protein n=1 Tax=Cypionkella sp. TaxID=2811411 RepID=UPI00260458F9|nr:capsular polysaccharide biosynthesis protein [Cypionkella sp.]MDB5666897.1 beta-3-deoxy-D-manno-oct-2-ulosonic acid transferase [Cypionkella sp.]